MRRFLPLLFLCLCPNLWAEEFDVLIYGATPAGIAAAIAAGRDGDRVLLVEPTQRIGGMVTNGLSHTDFRTFESLTGRFLEFAQGVEAHYRQTFGPSSDQARDSMRGTNGEPKVNLAVFEKLLAAHPNVQLRRGWDLEGLKCSSGGEGESAVRSAEIALFHDASDARHSMAAHYFIDASYEGDLLAAARVPYRIGRESRAEFGESQAPETADGQLQAYNFRIIMTQDPANRVPIKEPKGYDRKLFSGVLPLLTSGKIPKLFDSKPPAIFKAQIPFLPNGKYDINDVSHGLVRLSLPGQNVAWPDGDSGVAIRAGSERDSLVAPFSRLGLLVPRTRIFAEHQLWNLGLLYFLQTDSAVPKKFREEACSWGLAKDEFESSGHFPEQLYVREARRMIGEYIYTEKDTENAVGDARAVLHRQSIAMGDYGPNCHGTDHEGSRFGGHHTGEIYQPAAPYQIPYGVLLPKNFDNLLVPGAVSASHVGFCALRFEPIWMSLGEAAGHAAHFANAAKSTLQRVSIPALQKRLQETGSATIYVSDVLPGHPDFLAVQWWGTAGGLHGLSPALASPGARGKNLVGQYFEAFPGHAAQLELALEMPVATRWLALATELGLDPNSLPKVDGKTTRGDWLRAAWKQGAMKE